MEKLKTGQLDEAIGQFQFEGILVDDKPYGSGHINDTFLLQFKIAEMGTIRVILQRMNKSIFTKPVELMENILGVTSYLREQIIKRGGDPERETLNVIRTVDEKPYYLDSEGDYWRSYKFIEGATCYDQVENPDDFYQSAVAFGNFQCLLADYPAHTLHETIKGFHDTKARFKVFQAAVAKDEFHRAASVKKEIAFVLAHEEVANIFSDLQAAGEIPLRVTHNDTK
ncbi:MAG: mucin desulfatase, partial [Lachnospiraceae bacterium]